MKTYVWLLSSAFLFFLNATHGYAQGSKHRVGKSLTVTFPRTPDSMTTDGVFVKFLKSDHVSYIVSFYDSVVADAKSKSDLEKYMKHVVIGYLRNATLRKMSHTETDTIIGGSRGKFLHFFNSETGAAYRQVFSFLTIQDDRIYAVQAIDQDGLSANRDSINTFFKSLEFHGRNYIASDAYETGRKIGYYLIPAVLVVLLVIFVIQRINRNKRNKRRILTERL